MNTLFFGVCLSLNSRNGRKRQRSYTYHTWQQSYSLYAYLSTVNRLCVGVCLKNYPPELMQPSSSTPATIVSAENQNGANIFCHYYIVLLLLLSLLLHRESNNAVEAREKSWNERLKSRWIPGGSCSFPTVNCKWYNAKTFCCAFFAAAMMTMVAAATIRNASEASLSCGSMQEENSTLEWSGICKSSREERTKRLAWVFPVYSGCYSVLWPVVLRALSQQSQAGWIYAR